jgi:hypothetical protein
MNDILLTNAERRFRAWLFITAWMYAIAGLCFLFGGGEIIRAINAFSAIGTPQLPPYPLPADSPDGKFWLALSVSMMAMLVYISRAAYLDLRGNGRLVSLLLLSKFCSSVLYLALFATCGCLAYLVGFVTDASLLLATLAFWLPAAAGDQVIDTVEADIVAAIGDAMFPRGGPFEWGYLDFREECLNDTRRMFAAYHPPVLLGARILLRVFDLSPVLLTLRPATFRRLPAAKRQQLLQRLERHWFFGFRAIMMAFKLIVAVPFFNRDETMRAVGYLPKDVAE